MLIALRNGGETLVDDELFESTIELEVWDGEYHNFRICDCPWRHKDKHRIPYVQTVQWRGGRQCCIRLHRLVAKAPKGSIVDHVNRNVLDNRLCNLRITTHQVNNRNRSKQVRRDGIYTNPLTGERLRRSFDSGIERLHVIP